MAAAIFAFVFPNHFINAVKDGLSKEPIAKYRDDVNLQNVIDAFQTEVNYFLCFEFITPKNKYFLLFVEIHHINIDHTYNGIICKYHKLNLRIISLIICFWHFCLLKMVNLLVMPKI